MAVVAIPHSNGSKTEGYVNLRGFCAVLSKRIEGNTCTANMRYVFCHSADFHPASSREQCGQPIRFVA